jgi:mRNA-degrading endonuclease RelE of RelBE toxin-antitoxin system
MTKSRYNIFYSDDVFSHLSFIDKKYWPQIKNHIKEQLTYEPGNETRNRKPSTQPPIEDRWELRFGQQNCFRVFYKINQLNKEVWVLAIGVKIKERLYIGKKEIKL